MAIPNCKRLGSVVSILASMCSARLQGLILREMETIGLETASNPSHNRVSVFKLMSSCFPALKHPIAPPAPTIKANSLSSSQDCLILS